MNAFLNAPLLVARRERLGLTERELALQTGVSITTIRSMERSKNHAELRVRFLIRLSAALGIHPTELFNPQLTQAPQPPTTDDAKLEALLHQHKAVAHRTSILKTLNWTPERLRAAEERLEARLHGTGTWLQRHWGLAIWPTAHYVSDEERKMLARHESARRTIDTGQARLLRRLIAGELDSTWLRGAGNAELVLRGELVNLGWAERDRDGYKPTREVMASFRPALDAIRAAES